MFIDPRYLQLDDGASNDEDNEDVQVEKLKIIDIGGLMTMNVNVLNKNDTLDIIIQFERSLAPMEKTLFRLQDAMQEITNECKVGGIQLCDLHATTLLRIVASTIQNIRLT